MLWNKCFKAAESISTPPTHLAAAPQAHPSFTALLKASEFGLCQGMLFFQINFIGCISTETQLQEDIADLAGMQTLVWYIKSWTSSWKERKIRFRPLSVRLGQHKWKNTNQTTKSCPPLSPYLTQDFWYSLWIFSITYKREGKPYSSVFSWKMCAFVRWQDLLL